MERNYLNREISWLSFNHRVLQEAKDLSVPILERLRFLGIFSNNLDEFIRVRLALVGRMVRYGLDCPSQTTAEELMTEINRIIELQQQEFSKIDRELYLELEREKISIVDGSDLSESEDLKVREYFHNRVRPSLIPIMLNDKSSFPELKDQIAYFAIEMKLLSGEVIRAIMEIPTEEVGRFFVLNSGESKKVMFLDDVIRYCMDDIFVIFRYQSIYAHMVTITRDSELNLDDDISTSFMHKIEKSLAKRTKGSIVMLTYDKMISSSFLSLISKGIKLGKNGTLTPSGRYLNYKDYMKFPEIGEPHHYYRSLPPLDIPLVGENRSIIKRIREEDILLHFPYHDFRYFIDFLREAAIDPKVVEIGITIYRVAPSSRVINALINAAKNGKKVTVLIELQARFDEEANIYWSELLQQEIGVTVINGVPGLKVHSKVALVRRKEKRSIRNYAYIGTGNLNESTAKVYCDEGLFTSDSRIADEVVTLFQFFKQNYKHTEYSNLLVSPFDMRSRFIDMIDREIAIAKSGDDAYMILKMNSLVDEIMIDKIYEAADSGVKVDLIVRGISCIIADYSPNIRAISVVDKYLEHSRIYIFGNRGDDDIYIGSADWMPRNLNRRVEVITPILSDRIKDQIRLKIDIELSDNCKARYLDKEMKNSYVERSGDSVRSQDLFYKHINSQDLELPKEE